MKAEVGAQPQVEEGPRVEAGEVAELQVEAEVGAEVLRAQVAAAEAVAVAVEVVESSSPGVPYQKPHHHQNHLAA